MCRRRRRQTMMAAAGVAVAFLAGCSGGAVTASGDRAEVAPPTPAGPIADDAAQGGDALAADPSPAPEPTPTPAGPQPLRVVSVLGETGVMESLDGRAIAGVVAQIELINENGGLLERSVELTRIDTNSRVSLADRLTRRLMEDPPDLIVVSCDVAFAKPVLELADAAGVITVSPCADDIGYASAAWGVRNFAFGASAEPRGAVAAEVASRRYGLTAMVLRDRTSPEAMRFCSGFERAFREAGGTVLYRDQFTYDTLEPFLDRIIERGRQSDVVVLCSHVPGGTDAAPNVIEQLRLLGFDAPIVAGSTLDQPGWFRDVPQLGELTYVSWSSIFGNDPDPAVNEIVRRANSNGETPGAGASTVLGADAIAAWARAVQASRSADPARVAAAMSSFVDEPFLTGSVSFVSGSRIDGGRIYRVLRVSGGEVDAPELVTVQE